MAYENYEALRIRIDDGIARVTMDHPPVNLLDLTLIAELDRIEHEVEADDSVRVMVLDSADPETFAAHADVNLILLPSGSTMSLGTRNWDSFARHGRSLPDHAQGNHRRH